MYGDPGLLVLILLVLLGVASLPAGSVVLASTLAPVAVAGGVALEYNLVDPRIVRVRVACYPRVRPRTTNSPKIPQTTPTLQNDRSGNVAGSMPINGLDFIYKEGQSRRHYE